MKNNQSEIIDIKGLWAMCRRKWHYFVISVLACAFLGFCVAYIIKPKYAVNASMQLQNSENFSSMISGGLSGMTDLLGGNVVGEDEVEIATSHSVLSEVCRELGINKMHYKRLRPLRYELQYRNYPLDILPGQDIKVDTLRSKVMFRIKMHDNKHADVVVQAGGNEIYSAENQELPAVMPTDWGTFILSPTDNFDRIESVKYRITLTSPSIAAIELRELLDVGLAAKNSSIVSFQMISPNTSYAIDVVNTIMAKYILRAENLKLKENNAMARFLEERIAITAASLQEIEEQIVDTRGSRGILLQTIGNRAVGSRLAAAESELQVREMGLEMTYMTLEIVKAGLADTSIIPYAGENAVLTNLISKYNNAVFRRKQMLGTAKSDNAALLRLDQQIGELGSNLLNTIETSIRSSKEAIDNSQEIYTGLLKEIGDIPEYEYETHSVYRTRAIEEEIYIFLLKKQEENAMLMCQLDDNAIVIDQAYSDYEDLSLNPLLIIFVAIVFGLMIPPAWFYFREITKSAPQEEDEEEDNDEE